MNEPNDNFATDHISPQLISQIVEAIKNKAYGSVEIYIENYHVTQITERTITKLAKKISHKSYQGYKNNKVEKTIAEGLS